MFLESAPHPLLAPYIRLYWFLAQPPSQLTGESIVEPPQRVFPDGCPELIIHLGNPPRKNGATSPQPRAFIAGQISRCILLAPQGPGAVFAVRFQPDGLRRFSPVPLFHLTDLDVPLDQLWRGSADLVEQVREASDFTARKNLVDRFFLTLAHNLALPSPSLLASLSPQFQSGMSRIRSMAKTLGISTRQLERRFLQETGLSPKRYGRILRLQRLLFHLDNQWLGTMTQLAYELGYADQAHLNRDFKQLTGINPGQYLRGEHEPYFTSPDG